MGVVHGRAEGRATTVGHEKRRSGLGFRPYSVFLAPMSAAEPSFEVPARSGGSRRDPENNSEHWAPVFGPKSGCWKVGPVVDDHHNRHPIASKPDLVQFQPIPASVWPKFGQSCHSQKTNETTYIKQGIKQIKQTTKTHKQHRKKQQQTKTNPNIIKHHKQKQTLKRANNQTTTNTKQNKNKATT